MKWIADLRCRLRGFPKSVWDRRSCGYLCACCGRTMQACAERADPLHNKKGRQMKDESDKRDAWERAKARLLFGPPRALPRDTPLDKFRPRPGRIASFDLGKELPPIDDFVMERAAAALASFHGWLEPRLEEAFGEGMDYAVTQIHFPDEPQPRFNRDDMAWSYTMRWQGQMIPRGAEMGRHWTIYRRPDDWRPGWTPDDKSSIERRPE